MKEVSFQCFVPFLTDLSLKRNIAIPEKVSTLSNSSMMRNYIHYKQWCVDMNLCEHNIKLYNKVYKLDCHVVKSAITSGENEPSG